MSKPSGMTRTKSNAKPRSFLHIRFGSFRFYLALLVAALALHAIDALISYIPFVEPVRDKELVLEFQKRQLDIWTEMNKLLIALATVTIGAVGGFMINRDKVVPLPRPQLRRAAASWIFCCLSLYFGYLSYYEATWMLSLGTFNSFNPRLWWPTRAQFWTFLIAVILLADFVYGSVRDKQKTGG
ncbi:MAG: hypothetical protein WBE72_25710 [Terracidiphilus sp.]